MIPWLIVGLFVGFFLGVFVMAMMFLASAADDKKLNEPVCIDCETRIYFWSGEQAPRRCLSCFAEHVTELLYAE